MSKLKWESLDPNPLRNEKSLVNQEEGGLLSGSRALSPSSFSMGAPQGCFGPGGPWAMPGQIFIVTPGGGEGLLGFSFIQDAAKHPTMHRTASPQHRIFQPRNSSELETPDSLCAQPLEAAKLPLQEVVIG